MYLVFDTETTGLPPRKKSVHSDYLLWPRIVQIAWGIYDGECITATSHIIKPDGYIIPDEVIAIHGITNEIAQSEGTPIKSALDEFYAALRDVDTLVAHNIEFDIDCILAESYRIAQKIPTYHTKINSLKDKPRICTKLSSTNYCKIPNKFKSGYKWPRLDELYQKLFDCSFDNAHTADADVEATNKCYIELVKRGVIEGQLPRPAYARVGLEE
jgi:DNA polymerase-3 subunit alpha